MTYNHEIVWDQKGARIVCMDSMGHVDDRITSNDVVVAGSHSAIAAVELVLHLRLRGLVGHAAGPGLDERGISGLELLARAGVPAVAVATESAPIADGRAMYDIGMVGYVNGVAESMMIHPQMSIRDAATIMATHHAPQALQSKAQYVVHEDKNGRVIALDSITHADERINDTVICMGSHSGGSMAEYVEKYDLRGTITNDAGSPPERSAVRGMDRLAERGIPAAVVENNSARIGDGRSTYATGRVSDFNSVARGIGITAGVPAREAATIMLAAVAAKPN